MRDAVEVATIVLAFAFGLTLHVALAWGLGRVDSRRHAVLALVFPPLAPFYGLRARLFLRAGAWLCAWVVYLALLLHARS